MMPNPVWLASCNDNFLPGAVAAQPRSERPAMANSFFSVCAKRLLRGAMVACSVCVVRTMRIKRREGPLERKRPSQVNEQREKYLSASDCQVAEEKIQLNGRIRRSFVLDAFPCQPHFGFPQEISSFPKIRIASVSESEDLEHLRCKLILCPPFGHAKTIR